MGFDSVKQPLSKTAMKAINSNKTVNYQGTGWDQHCSVILLFCYEFQYPVECCWFLGGDRGLHMLLK